LAKIISNTVATFIALSFAKAIKEKFTNWQAFKLGLIDEKGKKLKTPKTKDEKDALNPLMNLIRKIKRVLLKVVPDSPVINFVLAASLLKEEDQTQYHDDFWNVLNETLDHNEMELLHKMIKELKELNVIVETTTTSDMPTEPVRPLGQPQKRYNNCPCFDVPTKMFFDIRGDDSNFSNDRKKWERLNKYYGDTEVAKFCRCQKNKGKTFYMKDTTHGIIRKLVAK
jgi:hypothetical protein